LAAEKDQEPVYGGDPWLIVVLRTVEPPTAVSGLDTVIALGVAVMLLAWVILRKSMADSRNTATNVALPPRASISLPQDDRVAGFITISV